MESVINFQSPVAAQSAACGAATFMKSISPKQDEAFSESLRSAVLQRESQAKRPERESQSRGSGVCTSGDERTRGVNRRKQRHPEPSQGAVVPSSSGGAPESTPAMIRGPEVSNMRPGQQQASNSSVDSNFDQPLGSSFSTGDLTAESVQKIPDQFAKNSPQEELSATLPGSSVQGLSLLPESPAKPTGDAAPEIQISFTGATAQSDFSRASGEPTFDVQIKRLAADGAQTIQVEITRNPA